VAEPDPARRENLSARGFDVVPAAADAVPGADALLLAVKPQVVDQVVRDLAPGLAPGALVVSIAAGISTAHLEALLPEGTPVVRVMPNTPAMVGAGMSAVSGGAHASSDQVDEVREMLSAVGTALVVPEEMQDAVTAVSGSGPAYVALFVDAMAEGGVRQGLPREVAYELALQTLAGTAELLRKSGQSPRELIDAVSSPGGTTVAALAVLDAAGLRGAVADATAAAAARSKELGT
jgi:pyrroline-5-carboxylate reductase